MEALLNQLLDGFIQTGQATAQNVAPFSIRLVLALAILLATRILAGKAERSVTKGAALVNCDAHLNLLVSRAVSICIWAVGALVILGVMGVGWAAVAATLGLVGFAVTVSMQDVLKNFVAGVYLLIERAFRIGDSVQIKDFKGTVEDVRLRTTSLRTIEGSQIIIPNATIFVEVVVNSGAKAPVESMVQK